VTFDDVRAMALRWPGVTEGTSYGTPALKVRGKFMTRLREDGETLVLTGIPIEERDMLIEAAPDIYYLTDHYRPWPSVLIRLPVADPKAVEAFLFRRWRELAPAKLVQAFEAT